MARKVLNPETFKCPKCCLRLPINEKGFYNTCFKCEKGDDFTKKDLEFLERQGLTLSEDHNPKSKK